MDNVPTHIQPHPQRHKPGAEEMIIENLSMMDYERDWLRRQGEWRHSDMVDVAYRFLSRFYRMIVNGTEGETE